MFGISSTVRLLNNEIDYWSKRLAQVVDKIDNIQIIALNISNAVNSIKNRAYPVFVSVKGIYPLREGQSSADAANFGAFLWMVPGREKTLIIRPDSVVKVIHISVQGAFIRQCMISNMSLVPGGNAVLSINANHTLNPASQLKISLMLPEETDSSSELAMHGVEIV